MSQLNVKKITKTVVLPGVMPRLQALFQNSFSTLAFFIAILYRSVNLLPPGHPFTNPANQGRFGVTDVVLAAWHNLSFSRRHIDQLVIFSLILLAMLILLTQGVLLVTGFAINLAWAQTSIPALFSTPNPANDIAYLILDQIFGIPGIFGSAMDTAASGGPNPFHAALHNMFALYSFAILLLAVLIFLYYFLQTAFETAVSGKPFGRRFDTFWTPVRLVVALGLLVPFSFGLNSAQYIVLYAAKYGSSLATNMWIEFNGALNVESGGAASLLGYSTPQNETIVIYKDNISGSDIATSAVTLTTPEQLYRRSLIALPKTQDGRKLANNLLLINACMLMYEKLNREIGPKTEPLGIYLVSNRPSIRPGDTGKDHIGPLDSNYVLSYSPNLIYVEALEFYEYSNIVLRFGERDPDRYKDFKGNVAPLCGDITIPITSIPDIYNPTYTESPVDTFQADLYGNYLLSLAYKEWELFYEFGNYWAERELPAFMQRDSSQNTMAPCSWISVAQTPFGPGATPRLNKNIPCNEAPRPDADFYNFAAEIVNADLGVSYLLLYAAALGTNGYPGMDVTANAEVLERGWGGAAIWYNRIAEINGEVVSAANNIPEMTRLPLLMEEVYNKKMKEESHVDAFSMYVPVIESGNGVRNVFEGDDAKQRVATALNDLFVLSNERARAGDEATNSGNPLSTLINFFLGTEGLFTMRDNVQAHPLAQLTAIGRSILDTSIRNLAIAGGMATIGSFMGVFGEGGALIGQGLANASMLFSAFFSMGIAIGVVLYYIVPFFPFIFFFFAVISWVKTIFEAMVGVPLWALAHLRLEGQGLLGQAAANGYILILDIFLRPALILTGLLAASIIFFAEVYLLHIVFDLVVENLAGVDRNCVGFDGGIQSAGCTMAGGSYPELVLNVRSQFDAFFFTILYTILVYLMANSTFKLIDSIPEGILRWLGGSVQTYSDSAGDPTENLVRNAGIGGAMIGRRIGQSVPAFGQGIGQGLAKVTGEDGLDIFRRFGIKK